jgi:hypothetical protein
MFMKIGVALAVVWLLAMLYGYRFGGAIHILLAAAILTALYGVSQWWRKPA